MQNSSGYLKLNYKQVVTESLFVVAFLVSSLLGACFANGWRNFDWEGATSWARCHFVRHLSTADATTGPDLASETISSYFLGRDSRDNSAFSVVAFSFGRFGP